MWEKARVTKELKCYTFSSFPLTVYKKKTYLIVLTATFILHITFWKKKNISMKESWVIWNWKIKPGGWKQGATMNIH